MDKEKPVLSVVTPTRGNFSAYWWEQLGKVTGNVDIILVYPPGVTPKLSSDERIRIVISPYKGEVIQRLTGLLNARGKYVLALDDDDFVHPGVADLVISYFQTFPHSLVLRLMMAKIDYQDEGEIRKDWSILPDIASLEVAESRKEKEFLTTLQSLPIAPLTNAFDLRQMFFPYQNRQDMHGAHIENFNNKVWKTEVVQAALVNLSQTMKLMGALTWMPFWSLDRLLGLYVQAMVFEEETTVGHWMTKPEQIRYIVQPQQLKKEFRLILPADILLVKRFPQYGYFWNLGFEQFWVAVRKFASYVKAVSFFNLNRG